MTIPDFIKKIPLNDEPRLALFDADGTLWENDIADDSTVWMIGTGRIKTTAEKWDEYKRVYAQDAPTGCEYLLTFYAGMSLADLNLHVNTYWREFMKLKYIEEPLEVLMHLDEQGFTNWVITGSPTDLLFPLLQRLPVERIVGMDYEVDANGILTGRHAGISCAGPGKATKVKSLWSGPIQFAAGNARLDEDMMRLARDVVWAVYPHPDLEKVAKTEGWEIKRSDKPPYGTTGWVSLQHELEERGLPVPPLQEEGLRPQVVGAALTPDQTAAKLRQYRIQAFISTWCCYAGFYFCRKAYYITKGELTVNLGFDAGTLASIGTAYLVAYAVGEFSAAAIGSRTGARRLLLAGMAGSLLCNVMFGFANNQWTFMAFMALNGLSQATGWSGNVGTMAQWFRRQERGQVMGIWSTCYQIGGALANSFAAFMMGWLGYRWSYWGASLVLCGVWFLFFFLQRNKPEDVGLPPLDEDASPTPAMGSAPTGSQRESLTKPAGFTPQLILTILMMGSFYFFVKFIRYALWSWAPYFLQMNFGLAKDSAGYYSILFDIFGFLGVLTAGFVSDRVFKGRRAMIALIMMVGLVLSTVCMWAFGTQALLLFGVSYSLTGFMLYGPDSVISGAGAIDVGSRKYAIAAAGIINGMGSCGSVVQELIIGNVYKSNPKDLATIFGILIVSAAVATVMIVLLLLRSRQGKCNL